MDDTPKPLLSLATLAAFCVAGFLFTGDRRLAAGAAAIGILALLAHLALAAFARSRLRAAAAPPKPPGPRLRWRRVTAAVLLLVAAYPASAGPAYFAARRWPAASPLTALYEPLVTPSPTAGPLGPSFGRYLLWWERYNAFDRLIDRPGTGRRPWRSR